MSFPKKKSRGITVDGVRYRWMVSPVDAQHLQRVRVEAEHGQGGVLVILRRVYSSSDHVPVTPLEIRARVQRALRVGWRPDDPGPDTLVDESDPSQRRALPASYVAAGRRLYLRADTAPLRTRYPWPSLHNVCLDLILDEALTEKQVGALLSELASWLELPPGEDLSDTWGAWLDGGAESPRRPNISGGVELSWDGAVRLRAGCCASARDAGEWLRLLDGDQISWNGHDPFSGAERLPEGVRFLPGEAGREPLQVDAETYRTLSWGLEVDLKATRRLLLAFAAARGLSARRRAALGRVLDRALGLA